MLIFIVRNKSKSAEYQTLSDREKVFVSYGKACVEYKSWGGESFFGSGPNRQAGMMTFTKVGDVHVEFLTLEVID